MRRGFTLLEVLLALAVIALLGTVLIGSSQGMLADRGSSPEQVFWRACQAARRQAVKAGSEVRLVFDDKSKSFVTEEGAASSSFTVPNAPRDMAVSFLPAQGDRSSILVGGMAIETGAAQPVIFYGDGTCTPFRVQFRMPDRAFVLTIDPWTCAEILPPKDPT
jgi:prepilin-type N-terminal cleavage/methylation domain-containing protein